MVGTPWKVLEVRRGASCPVGIGVSCSADRQAKAPRLRPFKTCTDACIYVDDALYIGVFSYRCVPLLCVFLLYIHARMKSGKVLFTRMVA